MSEAGNALLGIGMGVGENRATEAADAGRLLAAAGDLDGGRALDPAVDHRRRDLSLWEVNEAAKAVSEAAHPDANIIFGAMVDEKLDDQVWVTVVATGYGDEGRRRASTCSRNRPASRACSAPARRAPARRPRRGLRIDELTYPSSCPTADEPSGRDGRPPACLCYRSSMAEGEQGSGRGRASADGAGRGAGAARRRQRGRRGGGGDAHLVRGRAAADGPGRRRLHARRRRRRRSRRCWTSSWRRPRRAVSDRSAARRSCRRSTCPSAMPRRCSTSARPRAACYGTPAGVCEAARRWGTMPLDELAAPAAQLAREGVALNHGQAYVAEILADLLTSTPECAALWAPHGRMLREGEVLRNAELGDALELLGAEGAEPFYRGDVADGGVRVAGRARRLADSRGPGRLRRDRARSRCACAYRDREVLTNPPPSAGGTLLAYALALLDRGPRRRRSSGVVEAMEAAQAERTPEFLEGLSEQGFLERFLSSRLGSTTHISVLDADGRACSVTCTNGEGSGVVVPGTGHPPEQRDGRGGSEPVRLSPPPGRAADAEHDGAVDRAARRRGRAGARQRRLQPHPLGAAADDRRGRRPRPGRARGRGRSARALRGRASSMPSRASSWSALRARRRAGRALLRAEPVLRRRAGGAPPRRTCSPAPATRAAAAWR